MPRECTSGKEGTTARNRPFYRDWYCKKLQQRLPDECWPCGVQKWHAGEKGHWSSECNTGTQLRLPRRSCNAFGHQNVWIIDQFVFICMRSTILQFTTACWSRPASGAQANMPLIALPLYYLKVITQPPLDSAHVAAGPAWDGSSSAVELDSEGPLLASSEGATINQMAGDRLFW